MTTQVSTALFVFSTFFSYPLIAAEAGFLGHWTDGSSMECPFYFSEEPIVEWDQISDPPVTVGEANTILREWVDAKYPGDQAIIIGYQLLNVRPWEQAMRWSYFIEYSVFKNGARIIRGDEAEFLAITMNRTVLEPKCDAP